MKTVLVFEPLSGGHRSNFINWLKTAAAGYTDCRFVFFTVEDAADVSLENAGRWTKQIRLYQLFRHTCRKIRPDQVLVLELTHLELLLAFFGSPVPLSAILFIQYPELPLGLKRFSKHWKTRLLLWRAPVKNLFLLNGEKSCDLLKKYFPNSARFVPISDPAPDVEPETDFSFEISEGKRVCLFFGAISQRKGAHVLLQALTRISPQAAQGNSFVFCGEPEPGFREMFAALIQKLRQSRSDVEVIVQTGFVPDERMMAMFKQSDLILMPYTRPEYSSGILALAAKARTPVLGPAGGLLGRLIRENGLGLAAELTPDVLDQPVTLNEELCQNFVVRNTIENFTKPILDAVCNEG